MLADVGMVKMYSKSAHVNDLGLHRPAILVAWTGPPPVFGGNIFTHPLH